MKTINVKSLAEIVEPFILDVRTNGEYRSCHIDGTVLMPVHALDAAKVKELANGKPCFILCQSGARAERAAEQLSAAGLPGICVVEGGILEWQKQGLPVERGGFVLPLDRQVQLTAGTMAFFGAVLGFTVSPSWFYLSGFVGAGLMFAGLTGYCPMGDLMAWMPWNGGKGCKSCSADKASC